ncbi:hypothetical protein HPP92_021271, partial [Vanilla planifolia]
GFGYIISVVTRSLLLRNFSKGVMARTARAGESVGGGQNDTDLAVCNSLKSSQDKGAAFICRRSLRLKGSAAMCELEAGNAVIVSQKPQHETTRFDFSLSTEDVKAECLQCKEHSSKKQRSQVGVIDGDDIDDDGSNLTLRDLQLRCKLRKRKAYMPKTAVSSRKQPHDRDHTMLMEEDIELDETILFMKSKLTRSTHASGKRRKLMPSILNSSIVNDKMVQISQTKSDDISAVSKVHFQPETDNPLEEIEPISLRSSQHLGSAESACHVDKEIYKAWFFDGSDNENPASSSFAFINKCGFDSESSGDMLEKAGGKELASEHADSSSSNVKKSCTSNIKEGCQIPHDGTISAETRHQLNSSTQSESIFPNMELITKSKKYENLANGDFEHEHHELLSEESVTCDDALHDLDASVCFGNCAEVDSEGILPSIVNGVILDNEKTNSSEAVVGKKMISCAPELNTSSSCDIINRSKADSDTALRMESLNTSLYALKQDNQCKSCNLGSIDSNKSLETCGSCNHVVHGNHGELVRESMQPLTTCILNNDALVDYNTLDSDTLESNGAAPPDNLPSREGHLLNSFLAKQTFSDVDDAARLTGQFVWHFPLSQLHESEANNLDNVVDASLKCPSSFAEENQDNIGHFVTGVFFRHY